MDKKGKGVAVKEKKSRVSRACRNCRRSKSKCVTDLESSSCNSCIQSQLSCTYDEVAKKRGPAKGYIEALEARTARLESLLGSLIQSEDPRAAALLSELFDEEVVREVLSNPAISTKKAGSTHLPALKTEEWQDEPVPNDTSASISTLLSLPGLPSRQKRKISSNSPMLGTQSLLPTDNATMAFSFSNHKLLGKESIGHTVGSSELSDVLGQLSINENEEIRYQGRSSGLYLIKSSSRFNNYYWNLAPGPPKERKSDHVICEELGLDLETLLPPPPTQQRLLDIYFTYVHPILPVVFQSSFMYEFLAKEVPVVLLLSIFALASKYDSTMSDQCELYLVAVKKLVNYNYFSSKLVIVQSLILISYLEIGNGDMSAAWIYSGMAIRISQDLGLFRDSEKWSMPSSQFSHEQMQVRKRVWYVLVICDRYISTFIGRPMAINERDYDVSFPSEAEPEEHSRWEPIDSRGGSFSMKSYTLSSFNAFASLSVLISRIISSVYSIRVRVLGQSCEPLLSLLDQSLASWYLALPSHLQLHFPIVGSAVVPPHILSLHLAFYSALILLHRPFIPGNEEEKIQTFASHSICTSASSMITQLASKWKQDFTLQRVPPFLINSLFSAAIISVYNSNFDPSLASVAKSNLRSLMSSLREMGGTWKGALRQIALLDGIVDLDLREESGIRTDGNKRRQREEELGMRIDGTEETEEFNFMGERLIPIESPPFYRGPSIVPNPYDIERSYELNGNSEPAQAFSPFDPSTINAVNYSDLLNSYLSPTEIAATLAATPGNLTGEQDLSTWLNGYTYPEN